MQTNAERQFNEDYQVIRHLYFTCRLKQSKKMVLLWIKEVGLKTAELAEKEVSSDTVRKLFTQSQYDKDCMKMFEDKE